MICEKTETADETILRIHGTLDVMTASQLKPIVEQVVKRRPIRVRVDLSSLRLIDSSGVGVLVSLYKQVCAYGGQLFVTGVKDQPAAIFRLLRLDRVFRAEPARYAMGDGAKSAGR